MERRERTLIGLLLGGYASIAAILAGAFFLTGSIWSLYLLIGSPILLVIGLVLLKRGLEGHGRGQLPRYLSSRAVNELVNEWNDVKAAAFDLERRWNVRTTIPADIDAVATHLEPFVGRVRATGFHAKRDRRLRRLSTVRLQSAQQDWREVRGRAEQWLMSELQRRHPPHAARLEGLRVRGLTTVVPAPLPRETAWPRLVSASNAIAEEARVAAREAVDALLRQPNPPAGIAQVTGTARALVDAERVDEAIDALLTLRPAKPQAPPERPGARR